MRMFRRVSIRVTVGLQNPKTTRNFQPAARAGNADPPQDNCIHGNVCIPPHPEIVVNRVCFVS
jgi:hypothetical protein